MENFQIKALELRKDVLKIVMSGSCGHIGGDMSMMESLTAIYNRMNINPHNLTDPNRDRFVLSKGHTVEALYSVLADKGILNLNEIIEQYSKFGSQYIGHPNNKLNGIEMNSGSLGHGLSVCVGMALAGKMDGKSYRVYTIMGDGELAEGSIWEAAMCAANYRLDNLCAVVDRNHLQISGNTEDVMKQESIADRFESFGWNVIVVNNGNSYAEINDALDLCEATKGKPSIVIAETVKGYGSKVMENRAEWHHKVPTLDEAQQIESDLNKLIEDLKNE